MKIKFKNEGEKNSLADGVFEIWSWKIIVPGLMIPPRDLKIGTDGVCQTCLQRKKKKKEKVTVIRKSRIKKEAGYWPGEKCRSWVVVASVERKTESETGVCGPTMERKTRFSKDLVWVGKIIGVFIKFYLILKG